MIHLELYGLALVFRPHDPRPEIYINRLGTTTQIFELCVSQRYVQKLERNWNNSVCTKVENFPKSVNF